MNLYSEEQIRQAKSVDLLSYLQRASPSELVRISANIWCLKDHDSLRISNGKWYWFSRGFGGSSAVNFLVNVRGFSFLEAVGSVLENGVYQVPVKNEPSERRLLLPPRSKTANRVMEYLQRRAIDAEIIQHCLERNTLYESKDGQNAVFVGYDESGNPRYAAIRSIVGDYKGDASGSDKRYSFRMKGIVGNPHLHVFESAIDLLSHATLEKQRGFDWTKDSLLSLAGVYVVKREGVVPKALEHFLETYPDVKIIHLHLDNDEVGRGAAEGITKGLRGQYQIWNQPPKSGKDVNESLILARKTFIK
jgi:hypothetical protein